MTIQCRSALALLVGFFVAHDVPSTVSAATIGINLNQNDMWRNSGMWLDIKNTLGPWGPVYVPGGAGPWDVQQNPNVSPALSTLGYPTTSASTWTDFKGYSYGTYVLSYEGTATLSTFGKGSLVGNAVTSGGITTQTINIQPNNNSLIFTATNLTAADPLRNLKILPTGVSSNTTQIFNDRTLQRLKPFAAVRYMDTLRTNTSTVVNWADRTTPNSYSRTSGKGIAYEDAIATSKALKKDLWLNIPAEASNDYVQNLARLIRDSALDPAVKVHIEYGNELWHNGFHTGAFNTAQANANPGLFTASTQEGRAGQRQAYMLKTFYDIFKSEYAANSTPLNVGFVFVGHPDQVTSGGNQVVHPFTGDAFKFIDAHYGVGSASTFLEALTVPAYVGLNSSVSVSSLDGLFAALNTELETKVKTSFEFNNSFATANGLSLFAYEGGQHLAGTLGSFQRQAQDDPRMAILYNKLVRLWDEAGGDLFMHYGYIDGTSNSGSWGLLENATDMGSVKWDAVLREILAAGDANLDETVNYADFVTFRENYEQGGKWWEQGDFNGDRLVDDADFQLLAANLSGLTPEQAREISLFAGTDVPEPSTAVVLLAAGFALARRTRRAA